MLIAEVVLLISRFRVVSVVVAAFREEMAVVSWDLLVREEVAVARVVMFDFTVMRRSQRRVEVVRVRRGARAKRVDEMVVNFILDLVIGCGFGLIELLLI